MHGINVAVQVVSAGTALAGLILVYIGALRNAYGSYHATERKSVVKNFQHRGWLAFGGFALALVAAAMALIGKWLVMPWLADIAVFVLLAAFLGAITVTVDTILEIR